MSVLIEINGELPMKALNKPERLRYYKVVGDVTEIHDPNGRSVSIESSVDIPAIRKAYAPLILRKMPEEIV